jgi:hypothetical protein
MDLSEIFLSLILIGSYSDAGRTPCRSTRILELHKDAVNRRLKWHCAIPFNED